MIKYWPKSKREISIRIIIPLIHANFSDCEFFFLELFGLCKMRWLPIRGFFISRTRTRTRKKNNKTMRDNNDTFDSKVYYYMSVQHMFSRSSKPPPKKSIIESLAFSVQPTESSIAVISYHSMTTQKMVLFNNEKNACIYINKYFQELP